MQSRLRSGENPTLNSPPGLLLTLRHCHCHSKTLSSSLYKKRIEGITHSSNHTQMVVRSRAEAPEATDDTSNPTMITTIFSYNGNLLLAATISLLLVLLLHIYAKWFLLRARRRHIRRRQASSLTGFLRGLHHFQTFSSFDATSSSCPSKGLDLSLIASIPIFLYKPNPDGSRDDDRIRRDLGLECVICLSDFEDDDIGRTLAKCGHAFHVECIDMRLHSHTTCPICRAPAVVDSSSIHEIGSMMHQGECETVIEVEEDANHVMGRSDAEEVSSVVMDVFIVSVSVSRGGSARWVSQEDAQQ